MTFEDPDSVADSSGRAAGSGVDQSVSAPDGSTPHGLETSGLDAPPPDEPPKSPSLLARYAYPLGAVGVLLLGSGIRLAIASQNELGLLQDTNYFLAWARGLREHGLEGFHASTQFCDYPPLFLLILWGIGQGMAAFDLAMSNDHLLRALVKAPACLADVAIFLTLLIEGRRLLGRRRALAAATLYFLNPLSVYNSAYWGQVDAIHTAFGLLGIVFISRGRWGLAGGALALALLQKFQSIAFLPLIVFDAYYYKRWRGLGVMLIGATVAAAWVLLPFAITGSLDDVLSRAYVRVVGQYHSLTPSAFNVWQLTGTPDANDTIVPWPVALAAAGGQLSFPADGTFLLWLSLRNISLLAYSISVALILSIYSYRPTAIARAAAAGLLAFAFFLIPTEMHERYAHPAVAFLAIWAVTGQWKERCYCLLSALLLLNLTMILPVDGIAIHIAAVLVGLFLIMLVWVAVGQRVRASSASLIREHDPPDEPPPGPSVLVTWFRTITYLALVTSIAGTVAVGFASEQSRKALAQDRATYLSERRPIAVRQGWKEMRPDRNVLGGPIQLGEIVYMRGLGTHAPSVMTFAVPDRVGLFKAVVGIDESAEGQGSAIVTIEFDGREVYKSPVLTGRGDPVEIHLPLEGARRITLRASPTADGVKSDHVSWALARFE